jgi:branched-chain amino acid aminotransferase
MKIFLNGDYYGATEASVKVFDRGFLFGDGVFTSIRVEDAVPLFLSDHLNRLQSSARFFGIDFADPGLANIINFLLSSNHLTNARVKIIVSRGLDTANRIYNYPENVPSIAVLTAPLDPGPRPAVTLCLSGEVRGNEAIYQHKTTSYLQNMHHKTMAREKGFDDCILLNWKKQVCETATANLFFIIGERIITPPHDLPLLNGIMRQTLLSQGSLAGFRITEEYMTPEDFQHVEGAFITSAIVEFCPVRKIEGQPLPTAKAEAIRKEWQRMRSSLLHPPHNLLT